MEREGRWRRARWDEEEQEFPVWHTENKKKKMEECITYNA